MRSPFAVAAVAVLSACASATPPAASVATTTAPVVRTDVARTQPVSGSVTYGTPAPVFALGGGGVVTWIPAVGATINRGGALYAIDARPTVLLFGAAPAYRDLRIGTSGADVTQLELNLLALGYATRSNLIANGQYTSADADAVRRWQRALGMPQTGVVELGTAVFAANALRIASVAVTVGSPVGPGTPVLSTTGTSVYVRVALDTSYAAFVRSGDAVRVTLPDLSTQVNGHVTWMAAAATVVEAQNGPPPRPTIALNVAVDEPSRIAAFDGAPVQVAITFDVHRNVLAVPVLALLAEPDGGYAVRVVHGAQRTLVPVVPGIQGSTGLIEVTGAGLAEGELVEVPVG